MSGSKWICMSALHRESWKFIGKTNDYWQIVWFLNKSWASWFVTTINISLEIWRILIRIFHFWAIRKKCPDRSRPSRVTICLRFAIFIFLADAPSGWSNDAILLIFQLLAGEVLKKRKKWASRVGGVAKCENRAPTPGADQTKKRLPCSMRVLKHNFATPLAGERLLCQRSIFWSYEHWWF